MAESDPILRLNAALEGRYRIERELGEGGMATVYLAEDVRHDRKVALKVLKPELAFVVGAERFLAEIKTTAKLQHPHILPLHDSGEVDGFLFYVMPYVEGESLRDRLDRAHQLPVDEAVRVAANMAEALDYAHRQGVIHRDIKPANVLLQDGKPVIADFGIALAVDAAGGGRLTETGLSLGTPHYMSPEQATGDLNVGPTTDIYALGCVLYETLVGEPPFTGSTLQGVLGRIVTAETPSARAERPSVPPNVDAVIAKSLEKVPADRFTRAAEVSRALADPTFALAVTGGTVGAAGKGVTWWQRGHAVIGLVGAAVAFGLVVGEWGPLAQREDLAPQVARFTLDHGFTDVSPDGSRIAYSAGGEGFVRDLASLESRRVSASGGAASFSPDGSRIVASSTSGLFALPSEGGTQAPVLNGTGAGLQGMAWGEDGYIYLGRGTNDGLHRVRAGGGELEDVTVLDTASGELDHRYPTRLADQGILFTSQWADSSLIMAYNFQTGETTRIAQGSRAAYVPQGYLLIRTRTGLLQVSPFDLESLSLTEAPVPYLNGVGEIAVASNGTLVYRPGSEARRAVVLVDWSGAETPLVADTADFARGASLSPDGTRVLVTRVQTQGLAVYQRSQVWVYERGGEGRPITAGENERHPVWSPDGGHVAYQAREGGTQYAFRKRSDGVGAHALVVETQGVAGDLMQWTTGGLLVFDAERTRVAPVDGSSELRLASSACEPLCRAGNISHDGRFWIYRAGPHNHTPPAPEIFVSELDNWRATRQQVSVGGAFYSGRWLPGDTAIVYLNMQQEMVLATVDTVGGELRIGERKTLFNAEDRNYFLAWDPRPDPQGRGLVLLKNVGATPGQTVVVLNFLEEVKALLQP